MLLYVNMWQTAWKSTQRLCAHKQVNMSTYKLPDKGENANHSDPHSPVSMHINISISFHLFTDVVVSL